MPGPWKPWKTRQRFPTAPTAPWKSHTPRFPPSHSADGFPLSSQEKQTPRPSRSSDAQGKNQTAERRPLAASASAANRPLFQAHSALERKPLFRLIARWNQFSISGSFVDWKMLSARNKAERGRRGRDLARSGTVGFGLPAAGILGQRNTRKGRQIVTAGRGLMRFALKDVPGARLKTRRLVAAGGGP